MCKRRRADNKGAAPRRKDGGRPQRRFPPSVSCHAPIPTPMTAPTVPPSSALLKPASQQPASARARAMKARHAAAAGCGRAQVSTRPVRCSTPGRVGRGGRAHMSPSRTRSAWRPPAAQARGGSDERSSSTKEMMQPCLIYLHVISLVRMQVAHAAARRPGPESSADALCSMRCPDPCTGDV